MICLHVAVFAVPSAAESACILRIKKGRAVMTTLIPVGFLCLVFADAGVFWPLAFIARREV